MTSGNDLLADGGRTRLFPLAGVVQFPHVVLPLHIFEARYRAMTSDALADDHLLTIVQSLPRLAGVGEGPPRLAAVGCLGRIIRHESLAGGRYNLLLLGRRRVRLVEELGVGTPYRQARFELVEEEDGGGESEGRRHRLLDRFVARHDRLLSAAVVEEIRRETTLGALTDILAHVLPLPCEAKQRLLEEPAADARADALEQVLDGEENAGCDARDGPALPRGRTPPFSLN